MKKLSQEDKDKVKEIIIDIFDFGNEIDDKSRLSMDLGLDELDEIELLMELEKKFDIAITDKLWERVTTVSDIYECLEKTLK